MRKLTLNELDNTYLKGTGHSTRSHMRNTFYCGVALTQSNCRKKMCDNNE